MPLDTAVDKKFGIETPKWSIPPFCDSIDGKPLPGQPPVIDRDYGDQSFILTQAVVYEIDVDAKTMMQNTSENEDDFIEWSRHGDPCGVWMRLDVGNILEVEAKAVVFMYNRTHKRNCTISVITEV